MSERLTDEEYRAWIDAGSPNELEGWAIILALRAWVAQLEAALKDCKRYAEDHDDEWVPFRVDDALKDTPQ